jgi:hypothetical protein
MEGLLRAFLRFAGVTVGSVRVVSEEDRFFWGNERVEGLADGRVDEPLGNS